MALATTNPGWVSGKGHQRHQALSIIVENRAGVLARVSALFARRGFNIISLTVAPTDDEAFSRITIVIDLEETSVEQLTKQLFKLVNVVKITELAPGGSIERELALISVRCAPFGEPGPSRGEVADLVRMFGGTVVDVGQDALTVMLAGQPSLLDDFEELLRPYGIIEIQRTGRVALPKLERHVATQRP
ncbi:MAG: acetolactate synthase small subunit [Acidimicrobiales bacterium]